MKTLISITFKIFISIVCVLILETNGNPDSTLPQECGHNNVGRIVGGNPAKPHVWPWAVAIYERAFWSESPDDYIFICGGAIINRRHVLTASHCVKSFDAITKPESLKLLVGAHNRSTSGQWVKVEKVVSHPKFEENYMQYDIAVLRLTAPLDFKASNNKIAPICVADWGMDKDHFLNDSAVVVGWGTTEPLGEISDVLMQVSVPVVPQKICAESYDKESITEKNVCAGYKDGGKDSCQGDSGGPLKVRRKHRWVQIGITSWGRGCAAPDAYGVYTRVSSHIDWLLKTIGSKKNKHSYDLETTMIE